MKDAVVTLTFGMIFLALPVFGQPAATSVVMASGLLQRCLGIDARI